MTETLTWGRFLYLASLALLRAGRIHDDILDSTKRDAESALSECFGDLNTLHANGLVASFRGLSAKIDGWRLIAGLLAIRSNVIVHRYITASKQVIYLTRQSIIDTLLNDHVDHDAIMQEFQGTNVYGMYKDVKTL